jgi:type I restriction enzyme, R subunit
LREDIIGMMNERPVLKERGKTAERIIQSITDFIDTFISGFAA